MTKILDIGCPNPDQAKRNRERVKNKENIIGYLEVEAAVEHTPTGQALALWIPTGNLPQVGKKDWKQFGGDEIGLYAAEVPDGGEDKDGT